MSHHLSLSLRQLPGKTQLGSFESRRMAQSIQAPRLGGQELAGQKRVVHGQV
jgi:hypothetical protein